MVSAADCFHLTPILVGVAPILPTLQGLFVLLPVLLLSALTGVWAILRAGNRKLILQLLWQLRWPLVVVAATCLLVIAAVRHLPSRRAPPPGDEGSAGGVWPMARGGLARLGFAGRSVTIVPTVAWKHRRGSEAFYASPAVVDGRIYIVGSQNDRGRIYCFDASSGDVLWSRSPSGYRATFSSPVIARQRLVVGEGLHHTKAGRVLCLDLRAGYEGEVLWAFRTRSHVECTPVIVDDKVFVGAGDDGCYCLSLFPEGSDGEVVWHTPQATLPDAETSLAVYHDTVYLGLGIEGDAVCALDGQTGAILWRRSFAYPVFGLPAVVDGRLYVGMGRGDTMTAMDDPAGQVCCLDIASGEPVWVCPLPATVLGAVAAAGDALYCGCADGHVYRIGLDGSILQSYDTGDAIVNSLALADDDCYVLNQAGWLICLQQETLAAKWKKRLGGPGYYLSSPVIADGRLFVGTDDGGFFCLGDDGGSSWSSPHGGAGDHGSRGALPLANRGVLSDGYQCDGEVTSFAYGERQVIAASDDPLMMRLTSLIVEDAGHLRVAWKQAFADSQCMALALTAKANAPSYALFLRRHDAQVTLHCIETHDGQDCWTMPLHPTAGDLLTVDGTYVFVQAKQGRLRCLSLDQDVLWEIDCGTIDYPLWTDASRICFAQRDPHRLAMHDKRTGTQLWSVDLGAQATSAPVVVDEAVLLGTRQSCEVRSIYTGAVEWRAPPQYGGVADGIYLREGRFAYINSKSELVIARLPDRAAKVVTNMPTPVRRPILTDDAVLLAGKDRVTRVSWATEAPEVATWCEVGPDDALEALCVLDSGVLLARSRTGRIVCMRGEASE